MCQVHSMRRVDRLSEFYQNKDNKEIQQKQDEANGKNIQHHQTQKRHDH